MVTINVSLPEKLKNQAETLVRGGFYASFSDLVRDSLRKVISQSKYDLWAEETRKEIKEGKAITLKTKKDIKKYFDSI
ncbi:hypothetical protein A2715_03530 [Candidatus Woesebacteria bacterium RIFCSPHIGHO2_01_FULL_39_32]|uniref:CopG family transcriptional regulator n=1 Tax=Candidatus Woesebacteria bacterium RIFCSPLOWO2_01_FULL_39_25 TaxID=1802521 RepID=A0A1F8BKN8_9BACT|nr:MAG: hypothetical protein A2124_04835 [Candidatus Woesebacteria bacterium GWB1_37_5]OGM24811.1 MAG: hypothetical protein A2715_03530 [Candidatus Woesebacteria bacterium RIFCSPHIGHO2_01_FULL_39_32]OGM37132.1 MAG: hypothetical protein A3F01_05470 [Candidatus Woesebacteria bacterium RIFCSPHIGHO2_12_FULL_38_11]OGM64637.1 MAG: hypothetical protein A2893_06445 [Candidatus Woesebacteria bacterium RIFCSPLOWO2_01_FULL_39_25]